MQKVLKLYGSPLTRDKAMLKDKALWGDSATFYMTNKYAFVADIEYRYVFVMSGATANGMNGVTKIVQCCEYIAKEHLQQIRERLNAPFERRIKDENINSDLDSDVGVYVESRLREVRDSSDISKRFNRHQLSSSERRYEHLSGLCF